MTPRDNPVTARATGHSTKALRGMFGGLARLGIDIDRLIAPTGVTRADLENPDAIIPLSVCAAIFARVREQPIKNVALKLAVGTPLGANPPLDYLIASADSVGQGLERLSRYLPLVNPAVRVRLESAGDPMRVIVESPGDEFGAEFTVAMTILRLREETEGKLQVLHASFAHEPDDVNELAKVLGCPVHARASWTGVTLSREACRLPLRRRDPGLGAWLERQAAATLARQPQGSGITFEVRRLLAASIPANTIDIADIARKLAMTARTLQRRLAREGTSFEKLRDLTRKSAAEAYLADPALSIGEVTYLLGYAEPTAFHRAFKRWHGLTPQAFRAKHH